MRELEGIEITDIRGRHREHKEGVRKNKYTQDRGEDIRGMDEVENTQM